jgi:hypothetical protein
MASIDIGGQLFQAFSPDAVAALFFGGHLGGAPTEQSAINNAKRLLALLTGEQNPEMSPEEIDQIVESTFASFQDTRAGAGGGGDGIGGATGQTPEEQRRASQVARSQFRGDRRGLFQDFSAQQLDQQDINPLGRALAQQQFDPLSARFVLRTALNPQGTGLGNFASFLGGTPGQFTSQEFTNAFDLLAPLFAQGATLNPEQITQRGFLQDDEAAENIITQAFAAGLNPLLRRFAPGALASKFAGFREQNPLQSIFGQFSRGGNTF